MFVGSTQVARYLRLRRSKENAEGGPGGPFRISNKEQGMMNHEVAKDLLFVVYCLGLVI